jgi:preprotein translocase SecF subunit
MQQQPQAQPTPKPKKKIRVPRVVNGVEQMVEIEVDADAGPGWGPNDKHTLLNKRVTRVDGPLKATGVARYTYDQRLPGMLHARILRCPHGHARVTKLDTEAASKIPGVKAIIQAPLTELRFAGAPVAAVAATTPEIAGDALRAINVTYEVLPHVVHAHHAIRPDAPKVVAEENNLQEKNKNGDPAKAEAAMATADAIVEGEYISQRVHHTCLETHGMVVDFRGGDLITLSAPGKIDIGQVRGALKPIGLADASIQESTQVGRSYITIRTPLNTSDKVEKQVMQTLPSSGFRVEGSERVGALVGGELAKNSLIALGLGILGILIFVTFRFELAFAVGAIVALLHDVLMTVGMFALLGHELTLTMIGAVLTIAGYSINDTIVVYDRIREGLASGRRGTIEEIMNSSINQTLSRTILTSTVTLIPILCLFFFGGAVLRDFSLAIIIGVIVGTYSSIFIASPIVLWWTRARGGGATALRREITEKATAANPLAQR